MPRSTTMTIMLPFIKRIIVEINIIITWIDEELVELQTTDIVVIDIYASLFMFKIKCGWKICQTFLAVIILMKQSIGMY